jgi:hypothetical protein
VTRQYVFKEYQNDYLKCKERFEIPEIIGDEKTHLYVELEAKLGYVFYWGVCWTLSKLFDEKK